MNWKYYNHAMIPTTAPHEEVDTRSIDDGSIWKNVHNKLPLFIRWTTEFDCGYETNWWYVICTKPFSLKILSKDARKSVRKALKYCLIKQIEPKKYIEDLWRVYQEAIIRYTNLDNKISEQSFRQNCMNADSNIEYWAGFEKETGRMIGYMTCAVYDEYVNLQTSKYSTEFLKLRVSDALNFVVIDFYLNYLEKSYIVNGERSINHETNVQKYYFEHFNFRKAYCHLNLKYRWFVAGAVNIFYPFRSIIKTRNRGIFHQINSVLRMEEIRRGK